MLVRRRRPRRVVLWHPASWTTRRGGPAAEAFYRRRSWARTGRPSAAWWRPAIARSSFPSRSCPRPPFDMAARLDAARAARLRPDLVRDDRVRARSAASTRWSRSARAWRRIGAPGSRRVRWPLSLRVGRSPRGRLTFGRHTDHCRRPSMPTLIPAPTIIQAAGNKPKRIEEYAGRVNTGHAAVSVARMVSPEGWEEPGQRPEFEEITLVLRGTAAGGARERHARGRARARRSSRGRENGCATESRGPAARSTWRSVSRPSRRPPCTAMPSTS